MSTKPPHYHSHQFRGGLGRVYLTYRLISMLLVEPAPTAQWFWGRLFNLSVNINVVGRTRPYKFPSGCWGRIYFTYQLISMLLIKPAPTFFFYSES
ncbi:hypothetical protein [Dapis sp. BLCC M172]|uniref:hypothetical protein n=1 Tax=Dapis sp. BLCC M172 TaxID=2975281 RepID=UPI003CEA0281